jgi:mono/diheme cytochrome c family protein
MAIFVVERFRRRMVLKQYVYIIFSTVLLFGCSGGESDLVPDDYVSRSGEEVYRNHCTVCHGSNGDAGEAGAKDLSASNLDSVAIVDILKNGKNAMPRQGQHIKTDEEMKNLIHHIESLRK